MKHLLSTCALAVLLFSGCKFDTPLTEAPTRDIDSTLLGSWISISDGKPLDVFKLSEQAYLVMDDDTPFVCTHSELSGLNLVSCRHIGHEPAFYGKYAYTTYLIEHGELVLIPLNDALDLRSILSSVDIRAVLTAAAETNTALSTNTKTQRRFKKKP